MATTRAIAATGNIYIDGLLSGIAWVGPLTFSFPDSASDYEASYGNNEPSTNFAQLSLPTMQVARHALTGTSATDGGNAVLTGTGVTDVTQLDISDAGFDGADIRLAQSSLPATAYARYPGVASGGDVWFGTADTYRDPVLGNYAYHTALHEIGHALGLKHSQEAGGPGATAVPADRDSIEFTVMSYRSHVGASGDSYTYEQWSAPQSYMMLDIAALQVMYGADFTMQAGDSTYSWDAATGQMSIDGSGQGMPGGNRIFLTVWDGGGHDTYDLSNYSGPVSIDLTPGGWSVASTAQLAVLATGKTACGNVFNALQYQGDTRSLIEDAIGGAGADRITGNEAANWLRGNGGKDTLLGGDGADTLDGGTCADSLVGGLGHDTYLVDDACDVITEAALGGTDLVVSSVDWILGSDLECLTLAGTAGLSGTGNALANLITGNAGDNALAGMEGADRLTAGPGNDTLDGGVGDDAMTGGSGDDCYVVDAAGDKLVEASRGGTDRVLASIAFALPVNLENLELTGDAAINGTGNGVANGITGNAGANLLQGRAGNDTLLGCDGADTLRGGLGADALTGGDGADAFRFATATEGGDCITDFTLDEDVVQISAGGFKGGLVAGMDLASAGRLQISAAGEAVGTLAQLLFATDTHLLSWDSNGIGTGGATLLAELMGVTPTASCFAVIA